MLESIGGTPFLRKFPNETCWIIPPDSFSPSEAKRTEREMTTLEKKISQLENNLEKEGNKRVEKKEKELNTKFAEQESQLQETQLLVTGFWRKRIPISKSWNLNCQDKEIMKKSEENCRF